ncbi:MAG: hypothetical protein PHR00_01725 [Patescibacteria group bacterium]|nr:hypothetical protein [Patescibacteria group bacterium]
MNRKINFYFAAAFICLTFGLFIFWPNNIVSAVDCNKPTLIQPIVDTNWGFIDLRWNAGSGAKRYKLEVYEKNPDGTKGRKVKEVYVDGTRYRITDKDLLNCGNFIWQVQAECCSDRCDACEGVVDMTNMTSYCQGLKVLYDRISTNVANGKADPSAACFCRDEEYPTLILAQWGGDGYSVFKFKYSDGTESTDYDANKVVVGCSWDCKGTSGSASFDKKCGIDYKATCAEQPNGAHTALIASTTTLSSRLCKLNDGKQVIYGGEADKHAVPQPPISLLTGENVWRWNCDAVGMATTTYDDNHCIACRRAECGSAYSKLYSKGKTPTPNELCNAKADNWKTAQETWLTPNDNGVLTPNADGYYEWNCVGTQECNDANGEKNQNYIPDKYDKDGKVLSWKQVEKCYATAAICGLANEQTVTAETIKNAQGPNSTSTLKNFFCPASGHLVLGSLKHQLLRVNNSLQGEYYSGGWTWECLFPKSKGAIDCRAYQAHCRTTDKISPNTYLKNNLTEKNYNKQIIELGRLEASEKQFYCGNGYSLFIDIAKDNLITEPDSVKLSNGFWKWICKDKFGGKENCSINQTNCAKPPHQGTYWDYDAMAKAAVKNGFCLNGEVKGLKTVVDSVTGETKWVWQCGDFFGDIDGTVDCEAYSVKCSQNINKQVYSSWESFCQGIAKDPNVTNCNGICTGIGDVRDCIKVCADGHMATVTKKGNQWLWNCGPNKCEADYLTCATNANKYYFIGWDDFYGAVVRNFGQNKEGIELCDIKPEDIEAINNGKEIKTNFKCKGLCNQPNNEVEVTFDGEKGIYHWSCGKENDCFSYLAACGSLNENIVSYQDMNNITNDAVVSKLCKNSSNNVNVSWYNEYHNLNNLYQKGYTPFGKNEFKSLLVGGNWQDLLNVSIPRANATYNSVMSDVCLADNSGNLKFCDYDSPWYKEGSWMWQCNYTNPDGTEVVFPDKNINLRYYGVATGKDDEFSVIRYCQTAEKGVCHNFGTSSVTIKLLETQSADLNPKLRGGLDRALNIGGRLCDYGIVNKSDYNIGNKQFVKGFYCDKVTKKCEYSCDNGLKRGSGEMCSISYKGCKIPPTGGSFTNDEFAPYLNLVNPVCDSGVTASTPVLKTDGSGWTWECGGDKCEAFKSSCAEPPHGGHYLDAEFAQFAPTTLCVGGITATAITAKTDGSGWTWKCGSDNCQAFKSCEQTSGVVIHGPDAKKCIGSPMSFSAEVSGSCSPNNIRYQWFSNNPDNNTVIKDWSNDASITLNTDQLKQVGSTLIGVKVKCQNNCATSTMQTSGNYDFRYDPTKILTITSTANLTNICPAKVNSINLTETHSGIPSPCSGRNTTISWSYSDDNNTWTSLDGSLISSPFINNRWYRAEYNCADEDCHNAPVYGAKKLTLAEIVSPVVNIDAPGSVCAGTLFNVTSTGNCLDPRYNLSFNSNATIVPGVTGKWRVSLPNGVSSSIATVTMACNNSLGCYANGGIVTSTKIINVQGSQTISSVSIATTTICSSSVSEWEAMPVGTCNPSDITYDWRKMIGASPNANLDVALGTNKKISITNSFNNGDKIYVKAKCNSICVTGTNTKQSSLATISFVPNRQMGVNLTVSPSSICSGSTQNINLVANQTGSFNCPANQQVWSWRYSVDNGATWSESINNFGSTYTDNFVSAAKWYRVKLSCSNEACAPDVEDLKSVAISNPQPSNLSMIVTPNPVCANQAVTIRTISNCSMNMQNDVIITVNGVSTALNYGQAQPGFVANGTTTFANPGTYTIGASLLCPGCYTAKSTSTILTVLNSTNLSSVDITGNSQLCAGNSTNLTANVAGSCSDRTYSWYKDNVLLANSNNVVWTANSAGIYKVKVHCNDSCFTGSNDLEASLTVSSVATSTASVIIPTNTANICSNVLDLTLSSNITGTCENPTYSWKYANAQAGPWTNFLGGTNNSQLISPLSSYANKWIKLSVSCGGACPFVINSPVKQITLQPLANPIVSINTNKNQFCTNALPTLSVTSLINCINPSYAWKLDGTVVASSATYIPSSLAVGGHNVTLSVTCQASGCATLNTTTSAPIALTAADCACGSANNGNYVSSSSISNELACAAGGIPSNVTIVDGKWHWTCNFYGTNIDCSANRTACGILNNNYYTETKWNTKAISNLCVHGNPFKSNGFSSIGVIGDVDKLGTTQPGYYELMDKWNWKCKGDDTGNVLADCNAKLVQCGIASAEQTVNNNRTIKPVTPGGAYYGSFDNTTFNSFVAGANGGEAGPGRACTYSLAPTGSNIATVVGTGLSGSYKRRGEYYWQCYGTEANDSTECQARRDCGWAGTYATIDFATGQSDTTMCWTAEDVSNGLNQTELYFNDIVNLSATSWLPIKYRHGSSVGVNYGLNTQGICPTGYMLPNNTNWSTLENSLKVPATTANLCSSTRINVDGGANGAGCAGSGAANNTGYATDGLRNPYGFNANFTDKYWVYGTSYPAGPLCATAAGDIVCGGASVPAGETYCDRSPYLRQFGDDNNAYIKADYDYCANEATHKLRCVKIPTSK